MSTPVLEIYANGDILLQVCKEGTTQHLKVASTVLCVASPVFRAMLFGTNYCEGILLHSNIVSGEPAVVILLDNSESLITLCKILHFQNHQVPRTMTPESLAELDTLPTAPNEAYEKAISLIKGQDASKFELARKALTWIIYAACPLKSRTLQHLLTLDSTPEDTAGGYSITQFDGYYSQFTASFIPLARILSVCMGLVVHEAQSDNVRLVHYTTQEYFTRPKVVLFLDNPHARLAISCIRGIRYAPEESYLLGLARHRRGRLDPTYHYPVRYWAFHAAQNWTLELKKSLHDFMKDCKSKIIYLAENPHIAETNTSLNYNDFWVRLVWAVEDCEPVPFAVRFGLLNLLEDELRSRSSFFKTQHGWDMLRLGIFFGHENIVRFLLKGSGGTGAALYLRIRDQFSQLVEKTEIGYSRIHFKLKNRSHYTRYPPPLYRSWFHDWTHLHVAAYTGFYEIVSLLVDAGADCDQRTPDNDTPMHFAVSHGTALLSSRCIHVMPNYTLILNYLLNAGANPNIQNKYGATPLLIAICHDDTGALATILTNSGAVLCSTRATELNSALHYAIKQDSAQATHLLLEKGARLDIQYKLGHTPLSYALNQGSYAAARLLLERHVRKSVSLNLQQQDGLTPLHQIMTSWDLGRVDEQVALENTRFLLKHGARVDIQDAEGHTALHLLLRGRLSDLGVEAARLMLKTSPAILAIPDENGKTVLHCVLQEKKLFDVDLVRMCVENNIKLDSRDPLGRTPIHQLLLNNNKHEAAEHETAEMLVQIDPSALQIPDKNGVTILHTAVKQGKLFLLKFLIDNGVKVTCQDRHGRTPLHELVREPLLEDDQLKDKQDEAFRLMLQTDPAVLHIRDAEGRTALYHAVRQPNLRLTTLLIENGCKLADRDSNGMNPLHWLITGIYWQLSNPLIEMARFVIKADPSVLHTADNEGNTALHICVLHAGRLNYNALTIFVEAGANPNARNKKGETPMTLARAAVDPHMIEIFKGGTTAPPP